VSVEAMPQAFVRARQMALAEPAGPVYVALDADLQEGPAPAAVPQVDWDRVGPARPPAPDPAALDELVSLLLDARRPVLVAAYAGRDRRAFDWIPELAELAGAGIVDLAWRLNAPTTHRLNVTGSDAVGEADLVVLLDHKDVSRVLLTADPPNREPRSRLAAGCRVVDVGFNEQQVSSWVADAGPALPMDLRITADTSVALPLLIERVRERLTDEPAPRAAEREARRGELVRQHVAQRRSWADEAERRAAERPVSPPRLAAEVGAAIRDHDWVLTAGSGDEWAYRLWDFDRADRHPGRTLGTATQIGISLGVALAHRGSGRLVVDIQPDGDLMFDGAALWIASAHRIPLLVVMDNNRAYYNDYEHQIRIGRVRGSDMDRVHVGVAIDEPPPDFATLARAFNWYAEGPIEDPDAIGDAVRRAAGVVLDEGRPALVDVVCAHR
jgi:benzoylformate decarboxylase/acetolactate synthase-1/2/3 large subunit